MSIIPPRLSVRRAIAFFLDNLQRQLEREETLGVSLGGGCVCLARNRGLSLPAEHVLHAWSQLEREATLGVREGAACGARAARDCACVHACKRACQQPGAMMHNAFTLFTPRRSRLESLPAQLVLYAWRQLQQEY